MPPSGVSNNSILVAQVGPIVVPPSFFAAGGATLAGNGQVSNTNVNPDLIQSSSGASPLAVAAQNAWNSFVAGVTNVANSVGNWIDSLSSNPAPAPNATQQTKTPTTGAPGSVYVNPGNDQERQYDDNGNPLNDFDWHTDHGAGVPHCHNWDCDANGNPSRGPGVPVSPWPPREN